MGLGITLQTYVNYVLPGILIALALIFIGTTRAVIWWDRRRRSTVPPITKSRAERAADEDRMTRYR